MHVESARPPPEVWSQGFLATRIPCHKNFLSQELLVGTARPPSKVLSQLFIFTRVSRRNGQTPSKVLSLEFMPQGFLFSRTSYHKNFLWVKSLVARISCPKNVLSQLFISTRVSRRIGQTPVKRFVARNSCWISQTTVRSLVARIPWRMKFSLQESLVTRTSCHTIFL